MIAAVTLAIFPVFAAEPPAKGEGLIEVSGDWSAFAVMEGGKPVCYVGSEPQKAEGNYKKRGDTFILITHRPAEKAIGVFSLNAGYTYKPGSEVEAVIGGLSLRLFTDGSYAWAYDAKADAALVKAMKGGKSLVVKGTSSRGTETTDTYSLKGFTAAYFAASKACNIK